MESAQFPLMAPVLGSVGKVLTVNPQARFVLVDFAFTPVPAPETRLRVFRHDQEVGTVRMTGLPRSGLMTADIMTGDAQVGDEVRQAVAGP